MPTATRDPVDRHVGARIRMRRLMLRISQTKLADAIGLTFQQVQKYEKGANRVSASRLQQIADVLQVPVPFFFDSAQGAHANLSHPAKAPPRLDITEFLTSRDGLALIEAFTRIQGRKLRRGIVQLVEQIAELFDS